jgi:gamma-glutamyltranspeptidase/glutathione hydrolase
MNVLIKSHFPRFWGTFFAFLFFAGISHAQTPYSNTDRFVPVIAKNGMVSSATPYASQIGRDVLANGGNAIDAAVAVGFALSVTFPSAGNLGGGGFMIVHLAEENRTFAIDYREMAPALAHRDLYLDEQGNVDRHRLAFSVQSAGVPGTVAGLLYAHAKYGSLPLADLLNPSIALAQDGMKVPFALEFSLDSHKTFLQKNPASTAKFYDKEGNAPTAGTNWKQPNLANTLLRIRDHGRQGFYQGQTADLIVAQMQAHDGLITHADLKGYQVKERDVIWGEYRGYRIASMPPPSSGGVHLIQMLNVLEGYDLRASGHNTAQTIHLMTETMRQAYADRSKYLGDPDFVDVPVEALTSPEYADKIRDMIPLDSARQSLDIAPALTSAPESPSTTHFSVMDSHGNAVSNTYTINYTYGSGITVPGAGFLLNNEMDDFSAKPGVPNAYGLIGGQANSVQARKRPLSSMTPTIVFRDNKPFLVTGSPGGSRIITATLQTIINMIDFDMNLAEAVSVARFHHQWLPDTVYLDPLFNQDTQALLEEMGHHTETHPWALGRTNSVVWDQGYFQGIADPRDWNAAAVGY